MGAEHRDRSQTDYLVATYEGTPLRLAALFNINYDRIYLRGESSVEGDAIIRLDRSGKFERVCVIEIDGTTSTRMSRGTIPQVELLETVLVVGQAYSFGPVEKITEVVVINQDSGIEDRDIPGSTIIQDYKEIVIPGFEAITARVDS